MWSTARAVLALTDREFYDLTPRQYQVLLERHREKQRHTEWLAGVIASAIGNFSMCRPEEPLQPKDFPLALLREEAPARRPRINRKKAIEQMRAAFTQAMKRQGTRA